MSLHFLFNFKDQRAMFKRIQGSIWIRPHMEQFEHEATKHQKVVNLSHMAGRGGGVHVLGSPEERQTSPEFMSVFPVSCYWAIGLLSQSDVEAGPNGARRVYVRKSTLKAYLLLGQWLFRGKKSLQGCFLSNFSPQIFYTEYGIYKILHKCLLNWTQL